VQTGVLPEHAVAQSPQCSGSSVEVLHIGALAGHR
jgi:hypothetical protein